MHIASLLFFNCVHYSVSRTLDHLIKAVAMQMIFTNDFHANDFESKTFNFIILNKTK